MAEKCHKFSGSPEKWAQKGGASAQVNYFFSFRLFKLGGSLSFENSVGLGDFMMKI